MDTIYEEGADSSTDLMPPPAPRRILRAVHKLSRNDENMDQSGSPIYKKPSSSRPLDIDQMVAVRVLGEGAFGEVILVVDKDDNSYAAAVKRIALQGLDAETIKAVKKEALLQRAVKDHKNVLKYLTMRGVGDSYFELYLEYADGGELFDQIEPDYGMSPDRAQFYFRQLLNGLQYIHSCGIAHRDIKPENLLLDRDDTLKISDFGMATVFRHNGHQRWLETRCGTMPYAAPEVLCGRYLGEPVDIWSCGIVLVTMLIGELPWRGPKIEFEEYQDYIEDNILHRRPWCRLDTVEISLLKSILVENPQKRAPISRIKRHPWVVAELTYRPGWERPIPEKAGTFARFSKNDEVRATTTASQPAALQSLNDKTSMFQNDKCRGAAPSFSQPVNADSMFISQAATSQHALDVNPLISLVRRMTRFCVTVNVQEAMKGIKEACKHCECEYRGLPSNQLAISCIKTTELVFFSTVYEMGDDKNPKILIDFRLSKGDGIEFKRKFLSFKKALSHIICKESSDWLEKRGLAPSLKSPPPLSQQVK